MREALGDSAERPQFIETLPRKGYRFVASITPDAAQVPSVPPLETQSRARFHPWTVALAAVTCLVTIILANVGGVRNWISNRSHPTSEITALAVIPLENLSGATDEEYFADGMTDELITALAKTSSARITSRTSVMRYKGIRKSVRDIGQELNVDAVVEGTVTRYGDRVRITAQLIQVATDMHLWAETYDRDLSEVIHLQRTSCDPKHDIRTWSDVSDFSNSEDQLYRRTTPLTGLERSNSGQCTSLTPS